MNISFYNAVSGMLGYQKDMDLISHNMANINTAGYKLQRSAFEELVHTNMDVTEKENKTMGHGTKIGAVNLMFNQGVMEYSYHPLDFAIQGDGLFAVKSSTGEQHYTRNGAFQISVERNKCFLVSSNGEYVLDSKKRPIELEQKDDDTGFDISKLCDEIGIFTVENPYGLVPVGGGTFKAGENTGKIQTIASDKDNKPYTLVNGALERSNVEVSDEMLGVIQTQRAFQLNAKVVKISDEIEDIVNNLR